MPSERAAQAMFELRMKRMNEGLSPEALGEQIEVSGMTIRRLEQGKLPNLDTARKVAAYLDRKPLDIWPELLSEVKEAEEAA